MRVVVVFSGLALTCAGCDLPAPPTNAAAYPPPTYAEGSGAEQGWWQPFGLGDNFVAVAPNRRARENPLAAAAR